MTRPAATEAAPYYSRYIELVQDNDIVPFLQKQLDESSSFLNSISEDKSLHRYAPGKWTIRQVLNHVNDAERVFLFRAFWFARRFPDPLPSYEQDDCVEAAQANDVSWQDQVEEFRNIRQASISLFKNLSADAWSRTGIATGNSFTVRSLAYIIGGHTLHHLNVIRERYLG